MGAGSGVSSSTVTLQMAFLPLYVVTEILAVPLPTAVTVPFSVTVTTSVLVLFHVSLEEAVPFGRVAFRRRVSPTCKLAVVLFRETRAGALATVTFRTAFLPLWAVTVMLALPAFLAVILPPLLTMATALLLVVQVKVVWEPLVIFGSNVTDYLTPSVMDFEGRVTFLGAATT